MKCDKCIHKPVCFMVKDNTVGTLQLLNQCCCYVEVDNPDAFIIKGDTDEIARHPVIKVVKSSYTVKIKAIPIKSETLCKKCAFNSCVGQACDTCGAANEYGKCSCWRIKDGEPCRKFKRRKGDNNG